MPEHTKEERLGDPKARSEITAPDATSGALAIVEQAFRDGIAVGKQQPGVDSGECWTTQRKHFASALSRAAATAPAGGVTALREALQFYANGDHFVKHDPDVWDTVSGEPANLWEDEANSATVEDGSIARTALTTAARAAEPAPTIDRDALIEVIARNLACTYHCDRVWEAWSYGTMREGDFHPVDESDTPAEIADAVLALAASPTPPTGTSKEGGE